MLSTSRTARAALAVTVLALAAALLGGALFTGASADSTRELVRVTFRPESSRPVPGWRTDNGAPFDARRAYGWVKDDRSGQPVSMARFAKSSGPRTVRRNSFINMQPAKQSWGRWQLSVAPGTYRVQVTVGDPTGARGRQDLEVEGTRAVEGFQPSKAETTTTETVDVTVNDGHLTLDPLYPSRATATKLVSVVVSAVLGGTEPTVPPTTEPPVTEPPTTEPPTTEPPTTEPPVTVPPVTVPPVTPPSGLRNQMGFAGGGLFLSGSDAEIIRELDGMEATGATWLRIGFLWSAIESKGPGQYSFKKLDQVVGWAKDRGLHIVANVSYTPAWARPAGCNDMTCGPADVDLYARFMGDLVEHYAPMGVKHYEVWNEPNMNIFWKPRPEPVRYGEMLRKAYDQAHRADPTVNVMAGAFAPARDNEAGTTQNPRTFLDGMYRGGAAGHFDSLSFHPYSGDVDPRTVASWNMMLGVAPDLVQTMNAHGDTGIKIWGTEMSYATGSNAKAVSEDEQARLLRLAIETWRQQDYAGVLFFFTYRDIGTNSSTIGDNYGLVKRDFTPKKALYAMREFLNN